MKLDIKNNQSEIEEVQSKRRAVQKAHDTIKLDTEKLEDANEVVKENSNKKYLLGINLPVGQFSTKVPKQLEKTFISTYKDTIPLTELDKQVQVEQDDVETQNNIIITLEIGTGVTHFEHKVIMDKALSSKDSTGKNYEASYYTRCSKFLSELCFDVTSKDNTIEDKRNIERIRNIENKIKHKLLGQLRLMIELGTSVCIHSGISIADMMKYDKSFLSSLSDALDKMYEELTLMNLGFIIETYATRKPVNALNLIKIIKKGTDTEENLYTGKCEGIVVEVLTAAENKTLFSYGELGIHKKFLNPALSTKSENYEGFKPNRGAATPILTQTVNNNIYMTSVKLEYKGLSVDAVEEEEETLASMFDEEETLASMFDEEETLASMFDEEDISLPEADFKPLVTNAMFHTLRRSEIMFDTLIIPENINLSESFKAKYI